MDHKPIAAGKSSFDLVDVEKLFSELNLKPETVFLDVACGRGSYSLAVSKLIEAEGHVYAVDLWEEGIAILEGEVTKRGIKNLTARVADVSRHIPVADKSIDICLLATVLHDLIQVQKAEGTLKEVQRVVKIGGTVAVVEFKKIEGPPGPPIDIRITAEELVGYALPHGLVPVKTVDLGPYHYLTLLAREGER
jgi:ubiquinone/menaquinone biosynthesis C-methylase UbiE